MTAWHTGRTFYACICSHRDERTTDAPETVTCWGCGRDMVQWTPPEVEIGHQNGLRSNG